MNRSIVRAACLVICISTLVGTVRVAYGILTWARELPNRIVIQTDSDWGNAFGRAMIESLHLGLQDSNSETQLQVIQSLVDWIDQDKNSISWVKDEFSDDLLTASTSTDTNVAVAAVGLLTNLSQIVPGTTVK